MHTFNGTDNTFIHHNSDLSGDVIICLPVKRVETVHSPTPYCAVKIAGRDLFNFIASYVQDRKIAELEQATSEEIFGLQKAEHVD